MGKGQGVCTYQDFGFDADRLPETEACCGTTWPDMTRQIACACWGAALFPSEQSDTAGHGKTLPVVPSSSHSRGQPP